MLSTGRHRSAQENTGVQRRTNKRLQESHPQKKVHSTRKFGEVPLANKSGQPLRRKPLGDISKNAQVSQPEKSCQKKAEKKVLVEELPDIEYRPPDDNFDDFTKTTKWKRPAYYDTLVSALFPWGCAGGSKESKTEESKAETRPGDDIEWPEPANLVALDMLPDLDLPDLTVELPDTIEESDEEDTP